MNELIDYIKNMNWENIGIAIMGIVTMLSTVRVWYNKHIVDIKRVSKEGLELTESIKYNKAQILSQNNLINELSHFKKTVYKQEKIIKGFNNKINTLEKKLDMLVNIMDKKGDNNEL